MELRDRTVMILGGSGLVGQAVARRVLAASPRRVVLVALFEEEVQAAAASLEPHRGRAAIAMEWGDVFRPAALAKLGRGTVVASAEHRAVLLHDLLSELTEDTLGRSFLAQLLMKYRPDAVVDSINTATAFAYQDVVQAARELLERAAQETADRAAVEQLTLAIELPRLIRHMQILAEGLRRAGANASAKDRTAGTGGMGVNIPYTHSEQRPSRPLLLKSAVAGAHSLLLFLLGPPPGGAATIP